MIAGLLSSISLTAAATTFYVNVNNPTPTAPYTNWITAATNIQDAVDAAVDGDEIMVTDGVYQTGGQLASGTSTTNRVVVDKAVTVQSVNGPAVTVIQGQPAGSAGNGSGPVRCAYLTNGAVLDGFTLTNGTAGSSEYGGGAYCTPGLVVLTNCTLAGNSASGGAGVFNGTLNTCSLTGNVGYYGGGAHSANLNSCTLTGNAGAYGGGGYSCLMTNCTLTGNTAREGGGAMISSLDNCTLTGNSASYIGGGAYGGTLNNCALSGNSAPQAGGVDSSTLNNCTLVNNSASSSGGGAISGALNNCIVYFNTAPSGSNYVGGTLNYCCTAPLPSGGVGNTNVDPQLASVSHLSVGSPCRGAGSAAYASGLDIDGEAWASPPSIGCDEYVSGAVTGSLSAAIWAFSTNTVPGVVIAFAAEAQGLTSASQWDFGDGTAISNRAVASHAWIALGDYAVVLTAFNETYYPIGVSATVTVHVVEQVLHYVSLSNAKPVPPYTSWATAATNIQDAIEAVYTAPNAVVLVSNGVYQTGISMVPGDFTTNRVLVDKPITVQSVNGPGVTTIMGKTAAGAGNLTGPVRCAYLTDGAALSGFTLTNGAVSDYGGGVYCATVGGVVTNCVLTGNSAATGGGAEGGTLNNCMLTGNFAEGCGGADGGTVNCTLNGCTLAGNSSFLGGGAGFSTLNNCILSGNLASNYGGGVYQCVLNNSTLVGNSVVGTYGSGGGSCYGTLSNCIVYYNTASSSPNCYGSRLNYCCTAPLPSGAGNIANAPLFVDQTHNNFRLQSNSPCINAGLNAYAPGLTDLDGNPRIVGGTVDMGAYECQSPALLEYYLWLQGYGLPTAASAVYADSDGDGMNNWQEWIAGTNPTDAASVLRLQPPVFAPGSVTLTWSSVTNRAYFVERATNLVPAPAFALLQTNILGLPDTTSFIDTNPPASGPAFYRVGVQQ